MSETQIAHKVLSECLQVKEGQQVLVSAAQHTLGLASELAFEAYKLGAQPIITAFPDDLMLNYLTLLPEKYYSKPQTAFLAMLDEVDAIIELGGPEDPGIFHKISGKRLAQGFEFANKIVEKQRERKIPDITLPFGQITPQRAKTYGFDLEHWRRVNTNAIGVDHTKMSVLGKKLASKLEHARKVNVTAANGTNLTFAVQDRPVHVQDGILDEEDISKGTIFEFLPSGSVEVAPIEASAEGTVIFDQPMALRGKLVKGLKLRFAGGKLISYEAQSNLDAFADFYNGAAGDKDRIASFGIGLNPQAEYMGYLTDSVVLGAVHIGVGGNKGIGGANDTTFGHTQTLSKATVDVDGAQILVNGKPNV